MPIEAIFDEIRAEREYQDGKWGDEFDNKNTTSDWASYIVKYLGKALGSVFDRAAYRSAMLKVASLAIAAIETLDRNGVPAPRHFDDFSQEG